MTLQGGPGGATLADLAGFERAAHSAFEPVALLVERRRRRAAAGITPDAVEPGEQLQDLCAWAAGACYLLGDAVARGAGSVGPSAPVSAHAAVAVGYFSAVEHWLVEATEAGSPAGTRRLLPADPPDIGSHASADAALARGCVEALTAIRDQLVGDAAALRRALAAPDDRLAALDDAVARVRTIADYAHNLYRADLSPQALGRIVTQVVPAIALAFRAGQVVAAPFLLPDAEVSLDSGAALVPGQGTATGPVPKRWSMPGSSGFDRWCLSDPHARLVLDTPAHRAELDAFWAVPGRGRLVRTQNQLEEALTRGDVRPHLVGSGRWAPPHARLPWAPILEVVRPLQIGSVHLAARSTFTLGTGADDPAGSDPVVLVDTFTATPEGRSEGRRRRVIPRPGPGQAGFDPWVLTDPRARPRLARDPARRLELDALWAADPAPAETLALLDSIEALVALGRVEVARREGSGAWLGSSGHCPWSPLWMAAVPVSLGGVEITAGRHFTLGALPSTGSGQRLGVRLGPFTGADVLDGAPQPAGPRRSHPGTPAASTASPPRHAGPAPSPVTRAPHVPPAPPGPGTPGFDPWCATDPHSRGVVRAQGGLHQLEEIWRSPAAASLAALVVEVEAARDRGDAAWATTAAGRWLGRLTRAPWSPVLVAVRDLAIAGHTVRAGSQFAWTLDPAGATATLVEGPFTDNGDGTVSVAPAPAPPAFDLERDRWVLTDPHALGRLRHDDAARERLDAYWRSDPDPSASVAAFAEVRRALDRGAIAYQADPASGAWSPPLDDPPFPARLRTRRAVTVLGVDLAPGDVVAFHPRRGLSGWSRTLRRLRT